MTNMLITWKKANHSSTLIGSTHVGPSAKWFEAEAFLIAKVKPPSAPNWRIQRMRKGAFDPALRARADWKYEYVLHTRVKQNGYCVRVGIRYLTIEEAKAAALNHLYSSNLVA